MKAIKYLLLLFFIACRPDPIQLPKPKLTDVRWYSVINRNFFFSLKDYDPCNPLYGSCKQLFWLDANDNKFPVSINKDTIFRYQSVIAPDTVFVKKLTNDTLILRFNGLALSYVR